MAIDLTRWTYSDGCVWCPRCNRNIPTEPDLPSIVAAPEGHVCEDDPGTGFWSMDDGWHWRGPLGITIQITGQNGRPRSAN